MERLDKFLKIDICKHLNGLDTANLVEVPGMKCILNSLTIKRILRDYVRQLDWVDAKLYRLLHSALALTEAQTESETTILCKAIRYYHEDRQSHASRLQQGLPLHNRAIHVLSTECLTAELPTLQPFITTHFVTEQEGIQFHTHNSGEEMNDLLRCFQTAFVCKFDVVMYTMNFTTQRLARRIQWHLLWRLMAIITKIASERMLRPPILLIRQVELEQTEGSMSARDHFECLIGNLSRLIDGISRDGLAPPVSADSCGWWRVWRIHQHGEMFDNIDEAFHWATLQIATSSGEGSS
ncbi:unnamed protein product [Taenia asiatica]|uniref:Protein-serine/threonine phosphatase n=1 Tax=Taenia asiatica TaxID=60517 RepID=A0A0R3WD30_TAEAS|nr:unnamed protein product [Taenia asiatica]